MRAALEAWASFPVKAAVRPLVLISDPVSAPAFGFATVDAKEAFLAGVFVAPSSFPPGPRQAESFPLITAEQALALMRAEGTPAGGAPRAPTPLVITGVRFGASSFETDRGIRTLPAWLFSFEGVPNPAAVIAVGAPPRFPSPPEAYFSTMGARVAADGRSATITFVGARAGKGPCTADYSVDQLASNTAVAITIRQTRQGRGPGPCLAIGYPRHERVELASPLGNRVLVDAKTKGPIAIAP
ncbi:MAG TPA: hypothetical protein VIC35_11860 [Acidimicrobiia bacterium]|jgi:hypothetical protein